MVRGCDLDENQPWLCFSSSVHACVRVCCMESCMCVDASPAIRYRWQGKAGLSFSSEMSAEYCYRQGIREQSGTSEPFPDLLDFSPSALCFHATPIDFSLFDGVSYCERECVSG